MNKAKDMKRNNEKYISYGSWYWRRYGVITGVGFILFFVLLVLIYCIFAFTSIIPSGINLERADWLSFLGGVLVLFASVIVSTVSITQSAYFKEIEKFHLNEQEKNNEMIEKENRLREIKPSVVIEVKGRNERIPGLDDYPSKRLSMFMCEGSEKKAFNNDKMAAIISELSTEHYKQSNHVDNVWICIVNVGKYPIRNILIYNEAYFPVIRPGEGMHVVLTVDEYSPENLIRINDLSNTVKVLNVSKEIVDIENAHIPEPRQYDRVCLNFEDIDGNEYQQIFVTHQSGIGKYYWSDEPQKI